MTSDEEPPRLAHRVMRGVELNLLGQAASFAAALLLTPWVVHGLGTEGYALYTLLGTALGYLLLLTGGTGIGGQRFTATLLGRGDKGGVSGLLRYSLTLHIAAALLGAAALWLGRGAIAAAFIDPQGRIAERAPFVVSCAAAAALPSFLLQFCLHALYGAQNFPAYNLLRALESAAPLAAAALALWGGGGLRMVALSFVAVQGALALLSLFLARPLLAPKPVRSERQRKDFLLFSAKSWVGQVFWMLMYQGDRVFIGALLPLSQLGFYAVSAALARKFNVLCGAVADSVLPMMSELHGRGEDARLRRLYLKATEVSLFIVLPLSVLSFVLVPQFMTLWLGPEFSHRGTWPFRWLLLANFAYLATQLPHYAALAKGAPEYTGLQQGAKTALLFLTWSLLIPRLGILGAALGLAFAEWAITPFFLAYAHRKLFGLGWWEYFTQACWRPCVAGLGFAALGLFSHSFIGSWLGLCSFGASGLALFYALGYRLLDADAKKLLKGWAEKKLHLRP